MGQASGLQPRNKIKNFVHQGQHTIDLTPDDYKDITYDEQDRHDQSGQQRDTTILHQPDASRIRQ